MQAELDCAALSEPGNRQLIGADAHLVLRLSDRAAPRQGDSTFSRHRHLVAVADGVGRQAAGSCASRIVLETLRQFAEQFSNDLPDASEMPPTKSGVGREVLQELVPQCQLRLRQEAQRNPELVPMGTTLTVALIDWPEMELLHVGDSRCYLQRPAKMELLTTDHTVAEKMIEAGILSREDLVESRWHNVLWNAVSSSSQPTLPDRSRVRLAGGDTLLLCTDGLTKQLSDDEIGQILRVERAAADKCRRLVDVANQRGGTDNITVIVARALTPGCERSDLETSTRQRGSDPARGRYTAH